MIGAKDQEHSSNLSIPFHGFVEKKEPVEEKESSAFNSISWIPVIVIVGLIAFAKSFNSISWIHEWRFKEKPSSKFFFQFHFMDSIFNNP